MSKTDKYKTCTKSWSIDSKTQIYAKRPPLTNEGIDDSQVTESACQFHSDNTLVFAIILQIVSNGIN